MPSTHTVDTTQLDGITRRLGQLRDPDAAPLMFTFCRIIDNDNRTGVLAGTDKDGAQMLPVTYRPEPGSKGRLTAGQRNNVSAKKRRGAYAGIGSHPAGTNNNLTSAEYRLLKGPPLAPRSGFSRVITNLLTRFGRTTKGVWEAVGYWNEVVNTKGDTFLQYHFDGDPLGKNGPRKKRDLRGVRPEGVARAVKALYSWALDQIRSQS